MADKQTEWTVTDIDNAKYIGTLEVNDEPFEIMETSDRLVFGGFCNVGFIESGYIVKEDYESTDETLQEMHADLETYYSDGPEHVSRIVCNERM